MTSAPCNLKACSLFKILTEHPVYTNPVLGTKAWLEVRNKEKQTTILKCDNDDSQAALGPQLRTYESGHREQRKAWQTAQAQ